MMRLLPVLALAFAIALTSPLAYAKNDKAKGHGKNKVHKKSQSLSIDTHILINPSITSWEVRIILEGYDLPKAKPLPPGIAKNLARGKPLPPGIAKRSLPRAAIDDLPHYDGYEWVRVGAAIILVAISTKIIAKVLDHVFD